MERDRNLLFGVFAVQLRKISPQQLAVAGAAWAADPTVGLAARLRDINAITETDAELVANLVEEAIRAHCGDAAATLNNFGGGDAVHQSFMGSVLLSDSGALHTMATPEEIRKQLGEESIPGVAETPGRYSLHSEYARGGMGRVLLVHDGHLGRDIALKELLPGFAEIDAETDKGTPVRLSMPLVARFLQEARITGQLEHPSIVPVYELGYRTDGSLYYTMKLVRGKTLSQAIREASGLQGRLELLSHFIDLCNAVAYAHSRGVLHRDLKPGNVMVGTFGETVLLDWGLAKAAGRADVHADGFAETLRMLVQGDEAEYAKTQYGRALGTPVYMPPEQARGDLNSIDERSDVYALGAVLYEILTGKPPYEHDSLEVVLKKVLRESPVSVSEAAPDVPFELGAICTKAMTKDPMGRYGSAKDLAEDVQRFLSGALVQAHEYSLGQYAWRYVKEHRAAIATAGIVLLALLGTGVLYAQNRITTTQLALSAEREAAERKRAAQQATEAYAVTARLANSHIQNSQIDAAREAIQGTDPALRGWEWGYLFHETLAVSGDEDTVSMGDPANPINGAIVSPNGEHVLSLQESTGEVAVWDIATGDDLWRQTLDSALSMQFVNRTGTRAFTVEEDGDAIIWDLERFEASHRVDLPIPLARLRSQGAISDDGRKIVLTSHDSTLYIGTAGEKVTWETRTLPPGRVLSAVDDTALYYLLLDDEGRLTVHTLETGEVLKSVANVGYGYLSHDGDFLVTRDRDSNIIRIWSLTSDEERVVVTGAAARLRSVAYSPGLVGMLTAANEIFVADLSGDSIIAAARPEMSVNSISFGDDAPRLGIFGTVQNAPSNRRNLPRDRDDRGAPSSRVRYLMLDDNVLTPAFDLPPGALALGWNKGHDSVVALRDGLVYVYDISGEIFNNRQPYISLLPAGLGAGSWTTRHILDADSGLLRYLIRKGDGKIESWTVDAASWAAALRELGASVLTARRIPDTDRFVAADESGVFLTDGNFESRQALADSSGEIYRIARSSDGSAVGALYKDSRIVIWRVSDGEPLSRLNAPSDLSLEEHEYPVHAFALISSRAAVSDPYGLIYLIPYESPNDREALSGHVGWISDLSFSSNESLLVSASNDNTAIIWDAESGEQRSTLLGHSDRVTRVLFSHDDARVITASLDGTLRVWDPEFGTELLSMHPSVVPSDVFISEDGTRMAVAGYPGAVEFFEALPWKLDAWKDPAYLPDLVAGTRQLPADEDVVATLDKREMLEAGARLESFLRGELDGQSGSETTYFESLQGIGIRVLEDVPILDGNSSVLREGDIIVSVQEGDVDSAQTAATRLKLAAANLDRMEIVFEIVRANAHRRLILRSEILAAAARGGEANERAAAGAMRTISAAEIAYLTAGYSDLNEDGIGDYGTLAQLADPDGGGSDPPFIDGELGGGVKYGYTFSLTVRGGSENNPPGYTVTAVPLEPGPTAYRQYYTDETGVIRFTADGTPVSSSSPPLN